MRIGKRLLSLLCTAALLLSLCGGAFGAETDPAAEPEAPVVSDDASGGLTEPLDDGTEPLEAEARAGAGESVTDGVVTGKVNPDGLGVTITNITSASGAYVLPSTLGNLPVTALGPRIFTGTGEYTMTSLEIPATVTEIDPQFVGPNGKTLQSFIVEPGNTVFTSTSDGLLCTSDGTKLIACPMGKTETVDVPATVTSIGAYAFSDGAFSTVTLPVGLLSIGNSAFSSAYDLTALDIPDSVTSLGKNLFYGCRNLETLKLPGGLKTVPAGLAGGTGLKTLTLGEGITAIGEAAFRSCSDLTTVVFPASLKTVGDEAFRFCFKLETITWGGVTDIGKYAFSNTSIADFPATATTFGEYAFDSTKIANLTTTSFHPTITALPTGLFNNCDLLTAVELPDTIQTLGAQVFSYCDTLSSVTLPAGLTELPGSTFSNCLALTGVTIPASVTAIGSYAFSQCTSLVTIDLPAGLTRLGTSAFSGCGALAEIVIPDGITALGYFTFSGCRALQSVTLPEGLQRIDLYAFEYCNVLQKITFPASLKALSRLAFYYTPNLREVTFLGGAPETESTNPFSQSANAVTVYYPTGDTSFNGWTGDNYKNLTLTSGDQRPPDLAPMDTNIALSAVLAKSPQNETILWFTVDVTPKHYSKDGFTDETLFPAGAITVTVNDTVQATAHQSTTAPTHKTFGFMLDGLYEADTELKVQAHLAHSIGFNGADSTILAGKVVFPKRADDQLPFTMDDTTNLTPESFYTVVPDTVNNGVVITGLTKYNANWALFNDVPGTLGGNTVTGLGTDVFKGKINVTNVRLPDSIATIGEGAFDGCANLSSIGIPKKATALPANLFANCPTLHSVTLNEGLKTIGAGAFQNCTNFKEMTFPASLTTIAPDAFVGCALTEITFKGNAPSFAVDSAKTAFGPETILNIKTGATGFDVAPWKDMRRPPVALGLNYTYEVKEDNGGVSLLLDVRFDTSAYKGPDTPRPVPDLSKVKVHINNFVSPIVTIVDGKLSVPVESKHFGNAPFVRVSYPGDWYFSPDCTSENQYIKIPIPKMPIAIIDVTPELIEYKLWLTPTFNPPAYLGQSDKKPNLHETTVRLDGVEVDAMRQNNKLAVPVTAGPGETVYVAVTFSGDEYFTSAAPYQFNVVIPGEPSTPVKPTPVLTATAGAVKAVGGAYVLPLTVEINGNHDGALPVRAQISVEVSIGGFKEIYHPGAETVLNIPITQAQLGKTAAIVVTYLEDENFAAAAPVILPPIALDDPTPKPDPVKPILGATAGAVIAKDGGYALPLTVTISTDGYTGSETPDRAAITVAVTIDGAETTYPVGTAPTLHIPVTPEQLGQRAAIVVHYPGDGVNFNAADPVMLDSVALADPTPAPDPVTLSGISVTKQPAKTAYTVGDTFDPAGMEVTAAYSDSTTEVLTPQSYTITPAGAFAAAGTVTMTVTHLTKTAAVTVTVASKPVVPPETPSGGGSSAPPAKPSTGEDAKVTVTNKDVTEAVKNAADSGSVVLKAEAKEGAKSVAVTVPASVMKAIAKAEAPVSIQSSVADLTLDVKVLEALRANGVKDVVVSAGAADTSALGKAERENLAGRPVYDISITSGGKSVSQFGGGSVTVALPYLPAEGEKTANLTACWVKEDGTTEILRNSVYRDGKLTFSTPHLSTYAILHTDVSFLDVTADSWALNDIGFTVSHGLLNGMGDNGAGGNLFGPAYPLVGSMAVSALARLDGVPDGTPGPYWSAPALTWAKEKGILPEDFDPNAILTREQLAYLVAHTIDSEGTASGPAYLDMDQISASCLGSVNRLTALGIMTGTGDGYFSPHVALTRSELAAILHRLMLQ